jgi:multidrug efflux pump subunit AcrA (membrane-fusion protein)
MLVILLVASGIVIFLAGGTGRKGATVLATSVVGKETVVREILATGIIKAEEGAIVKTGSRFTGVIAKLHVKLGDCVEKGQLIAELDNREQKFECAKLEAGLQKFREQKALIEHTYPLQIKAAEAALETARAEHKYALVTYNRIKPLTEQRAASKTDLDEAIYREAATGYAMVSCLATKDRLEREFGIKLREVTALIAETEAELGVAQTRLSYSLIVSPMKGQVSEITAQEGETVVAGLQVVNLISVMDASRLELQIYVDENDIPSVLPGGSVSFSVAGLPGRIFSGTVHLIHPAPELRDNVVYYRAIVKLAPETALSLRPEMTADCRILAERKHNVIAVPNNALKWIGDGRCLLVRKGSTIIPVRPHIGLAGTHYTEILEGIVEGDEVVTDLELPDKLPDTWRNALEKPESSTEKRP